MASPVPTKFGVILYEQFEVLDVYGPLEAWNMLSRYPGNENFELSIIAPSMEPVTAGAAGETNSFMSKQLFVPTHTFSNAPDLDVLLVPGGIGATPDDPAAVQDVVDFIQDRFPAKVKYLITVCTGSALAARAGVLDGHKATTNKRRWKQVTAMGPKTHWVGQARWVRSDNIWTTSGVSAGTDGTIDWIQTVYGEKAVNMGIHGMEYNRVTDSSNDPFAAENDAQDVYPVA